MPRYIDADKLVAWCNETIKAQSTATGKEYVNAFLTAAFSCPTADVVEVVRCKDCKYLTKKMIADDSVWICKNAEGMVSPDPDLYCSYGERKEDERNATY